jgi:NAD(P)-dependent dehydrogenase (short-subunit alcohol dehydrogenase family)
MLKDKVVLITGGARGIGKDIATACAKEGAKVIVCARSKNEVDKTTQELKDLNSGNTWGFACDVSKTAEVSALFSFIENQLGSLYALVSAAGIYGPIGSFVENSLEEWEQAIQTNLFGTTRCMQRALRMMIPKKEGRIVLFSGGGQGALPNFSSYVTSKGAIWRLTETVAAEVLENQIYVNAIAPGAVNTRFLDDLLKAGPEKVGEAFYRKALEQQKSGGVPPEKATELALYLLSEKSKGLSGKILSALWDPYPSFVDLDKITQSDLYTMRRKDKP